MEEGKVKEKVMIGYEVVEQAVKVRIIHVFGIDEPLCQKGDMDALFESMQKVNAPRGFLLEYAGGEKLKNAPFNGKMWGWLMNGYALVRYQGDSTQIEIDARQTVDQIVKLVDGFQTLGGLVALASLIEIDPPMPSTINDVPFYWIPFTINIMERI
jgi:hypothetical protein